MKWIHSSLCFPTGQTDIPEVKVILCFTVMVAITMHGCQRRYDLGILLMTLPVSDSMLL